MGAARGGRFIPNAKAGNELDAGRDRAREKFIDNQIDD